MSNDDFQQGGNHPLTANDDYDVIPAGSGAAATGNTITGRGTVSGAAGADDAGAGNAHVTGITGAGGGDGSSMEAAGRYGSIKIDAQGNYTYTHHKGSPDNVEDVFTYTLADKSGTIDSARLVIRIDGTEEAKVQDNAQRIVAGNEVITLPAGVELSDIHVVGRDLVINLPDGTQMVITDGAVFVPQLALGDVEIPSDTLASLLIDSEPRPAAGPPQSGGGNFGEPVAPLDPGVPLGDLLPPTEMAYTPPTFEETYIPQRPNAPDNIPEIFVQPDGQPASISAVDEVDEGALPARTGEPAGSHSASTDEVTSGNIVFNSPDGVATITITINGVAYVVVGAGAVTDIPGDYGTLHINGVNVAAGTISYTYTLLDNVNHQTDTTPWEDFAVSLVDSDGDVANATLRINIADDVPTAIADVDSVTEDGATVADGNVFTGVGGTDANGTDGVADVQGADGAHVTGVSFAGTAGTLGAIVHGTYGDLVLQSSGAYVYTLRNGDANVQALHAGQTVTEVFNYTITDGDGDPSTTTLTITVIGTNDRPVLVSGTTAVTEEGFVAGNPDALGNPTDVASSATSSGNLSISDGDGDPLTLTLGAPAGSFTSRGQAITWATTDGGHTLTGSTAAGAVIVITIDNAGHYTVNLLAQLDHPVTGTSPATSEDALSIIVPVQASDGTAATSGTLTVIVEDDSPVLSGQVTIGANVDLDESNSGSPVLSPAGAISATSVGAIILAPVSYGGDGQGAAPAYSLTINSAASGLVTADGNHAITLVQVDATHINGVFNDGADKVAFAITINANGTLTVTQNYALEHSDAGNTAIAYNDTNSPLTLDGLITAHVVYEDYDHDTVEATAGIGGLIRFFDDGPSVAVSVQLPTGQALDGLTLVTTDDGTEGAGSTSDSTTANFGGVFSVTANGGADGLASSSLTFDLRLIAGSGPVNSGLTSHGQIIYLFQIDANTIVAATSMTAVGAGDPSAVFSLTTTDGGLVTLTQYQQIDHAAESPSGAPFIDQSVLLGTGLVELVGTGTAIDNDGDYANDVKSLDLGGLVRFVDDGPAISVSLNQGASLHIDESVPGTDGPGETDATGLGQVTVALSTLLTITNTQVSADSPTGYGYALLLGPATGGLVASGLMTSDGNLPIYLYNVGGMIVGSTSAIANGSGISLANTVFTVALSGTDVVMTQYQAIEHTNTNNFDENSSPLSTGALILQVTATDFDGDTDVKTVDLGSVITFGDDGPNAVDHAVAGTQPEGLPVVIDVTADIDGGSDGLDHVEIISKTGAGTLTYNAVTHQFTYTPAAGESGPVSFVYRVFDKDGDHDDATVSFTLDNDSKPTLSVTDLVVDEKGLPLGTGELTDPAPNTDNSEMASGTMTITTGNDTLGAVEVQDKNGTWINVTGATVGSPVVVQGTHGFLTVVSDGAGHYSYTYTLTTAYDHPDNDPNDGDGIRGLADALAGDNFAVRVTDNEGDVTTVTGTTTINVTVLDDAPVQTGAVVTAHVDEDELPSGITDGDGQTTVATGSLSSLIVVGADQPGTFGFNLTGVTLPSITSAGLGVSYAVVGGKLVAYTGADQNNAANYVFTVEVTSGGNYTFTLLKAIDHTGAGLTGSGDDQIKTLDLSGAVVVTDHDGDAIHLDAGSFLVEIEDDIPGQNGQTVTAHVDEDELPNGITDGDAQTTVATGSLAGLFNVGADQPGTFGIDLTGVTLPSITSAGLAVTYAVVSGKLVAYTGADQNNAANYVFTVEVTSGGNYTVTLLKQIDHTGAGLSGSGDDQIKTLDLSAAFTVTDKDGDTAHLDAGSFKVEIEDDIPGQNGQTITAHVDEDELPNGITDGDAQTTVATGSLAGLFNVGADQPGTFGIDLTGVTLPSITSAGLAVTYAVVSGKLVAYTGADQNNAANYVFTVEVTSGGNYTVTLLKQIDHTGAGLSGSGDDQIKTLDLSAAFTVTDKDGDTVHLDAGSFNVAIEDDIPGQNANTVTAHVDEDELPNGITDGDGQTTVATGSLSGLVNVGADQPGTFGFDLTGVTLPTITSAGLAVTYAIVSGKLVAYTGADQNNAANYVFTVEVTSGGNYTVTLLKQIDHTGAGLSGSGDDQIKTLDLSGAITVTDKDGDVAHLDTGSFLVEIEDDIPGQNGNTVTAHVDEDELPSGITDGDGQTTVATGSLSGLFNVGADQPGTFGFDLTGVTLPTITSAGLAVTYAIVSGKLVAYTGADQNNAANYVFTVEVTSGGNYTVTLLKQIDHTGAGLSGSGDDQIKTLDLSAAFTVTDKDGDTIHLDAGSFKVEIEDDIPTQNANSVSARVEEDELPGGITDGDAFTTVATGSLANLANVGADQPGTFTFELTGATLPSITSGGAPVNYTVLSGKLVAYIGADATITANQVFTVELTSGGTYTVTLLKAIDHSGPLASGSGDDQIMTLDLSSGVMVTDKDGDSIHLDAGSFKVVIEDDIPTVTAALNGAGSVTLDESASASIASTITLVGITKGNDLDVTGTGAIARTVGSASIITASANYGADGAHAAPSLNYSLSIQDAASGLTLTDGSTIGLSMNNNSVVGVVTSGTLIGQAAFAISIDATSGVLTVEQYLSLNHPDASNPDDSINMIADRIAATVTATDADNDTATSNTVDISTQVKFEDAGPILTSASNINIQNSGDVAHTGAFAYFLGSDGAMTDNNVFKTVTGSATVNGNAVSNYMISETSENALTAVYSFSFDYPTGTGGTAHETGTLTFDKVAGTYTVDLDNPIAGFSVLATAGAPASAFINYNADGSTSNGPTNIATVQLANNFFIQFTGDSGGSHTTVAPDGTFVPTTGTFAGLELFTGSAATVTVSSSAAGVAGNTLQGGEVLDFNLYTANPFQNTGTPTQNATSMFIQLDGVGATEDMIVVLKLFDTVLGTYTSKALMVQNGDIIKTNATLTGTPYAGITLDNNDGLVVIEANDYQQGNANLVIVGAQIAGSDSGVTGTAINLNGAVGASGGSSGTQAFSTDVNDNPFKIQNIGFLTTTTTNQNASLSFDVTIQDGDGDSIHQALTATVTSAADSSTPIALSPAVTTVNAVVADEVVQIGDGGLLKGDAIVSTKYSGDAYSLKAPSLTDEQRLVANASNASLLAVAAGALGMAQPAAAIEQDGSGTAATEDQSAVAAPSDSPAPTVEAQDSPAAESLAAPKAEPVQEAPSVHHNEVVTDDSKVAIDTPHADDGANSAPAAGTDAQVAPPTPIVDVAPMTVMAEAAPAASVDQGGSHQNAVISSEIIEQPNNAIEQVLAKFGGPGAIESLAQVQSDGKAVQGWDNADFAHLPVGVMEHIGAEASLLHPDAVQPVMHG